uniref:Galectin n=1 Tax=Astyanax mexicanus TaxID=7994 RepID=A0A3B1IJD0_ASTMX
GSGQITAEVGVKLGGQNITNFSFYSRFSINFKTGSSDGDDVALHFNPRIGQKVTLNSFRNGKWESEESASAEPFTQGSSLHHVFRQSTRGLRGCVFYILFINNVK